MKPFFSIWLILCLFCSPLHAQQLEYIISGGEQLTIQLKAEQQKWFVFGQRILAVGVVNGKLITDEFDWPVLPKPEPTPPKPEPTPPTPKKWQIAFFIETADLDNYTSEQKTYLSSLTLRKQLQDKGHYFLGVFDKDAEPYAAERLKPWFSAAKGKTPCVVLAPIEGGNLYTYPLPATVKELWKLVESHQ